MCKNDQYGYQPVLPWLLLTFSLCWSYRRQFLPTSQNGARTIMSTESSFSILVNSQCDYTVSMTSVLYQCNKVAPHRFRSVQKHKRQWWLWVSIDKRCLKWQLQKKQISFWPSQILNPDLPHHILISYTKLLTKHGKNKDRK